jgi:hypothetical protein
LNVNNESKKKKRKKLENHFHHKHKTAQRSFFSAAFSGAASFSKSILLCLPLLKPLLPFSKAIAESSIKLNVNNLGGKLVEFCLNNMNEYGRD